MSDNYPLSKSIKIEAETLRFKSSFLSTTVRASNDQYGDYVDKSDYHKEVSHINSLIDVLIERGIARYNEKTGIIEWVDDLEETTE